MERRASAIADAPPDVVYEIVADLGRFPEWITEVPTVEVAEPLHGESEPAHWVTLKARVGPFSRSKRLRMLRTTADAPTQVIYERAEADGRDHSAWVLEANLADQTRDGQPSTRVEVALRYDGGLWSTVLEPVVGSMINNAVPRLRALAEQA